MRGLSFLAILFFVAKTYAFEPDFLKQMRPERLNDDGLSLLSAVDFPLAFSHSQARLGVASGNYVDIAGKASSTLRYQKDVHNFDTAIYWAESFSTSPSSDGTWDKSMDLLRFDNRYVHQTLSWLSTFVHARVETSVFESHSRHDEQKTYEIRGIDDVAKESRKLKDLKLANGFSPIFVQENIGILTNLVENPSVHLEAKTALSLRQNFAFGQRVLVKEDKTSVIVRDLGNSYQFGYLLGASIHGELLDAIIYRAGLDTTWPFWQIPAQKKSFLNSLIIEGSANVALKLSSFSTIQYQYTVARLPEIVDQLQQYHLVNLNIGFEWFHSFGQQG